MKVIFNWKLIIMLLILLLFIMMFSINVYATDTAFTLGSESIDVVLNGTANISYEGTSDIVIWESSDTSVATVNNGTVSALKIGTTTITATSGGETATCTVNVVYASISIKKNPDKHVSSLNLVLNEYDTENLYGSVIDSFFETVENASVAWDSSDSNVVTVDQKGTIKGIKAGKATITASATGVSDTCEVTVVNGPIFTDFSNAKYELLFDSYVNLKITSITPKEENDYYYIITSNNTKPSLSKVSYGSFDIEIGKDANNLNVNTKENSLYSTTLDKYVELNQDLYLWVIEDVKLEEVYETEDNKFVSHSTKFVVEGVKLTKPELPQLNLILKSINISDEGTRMDFLFPTAVENRKFKIKFGKVTDNSILQKIQNNDYSGVTSLLTYAKNNNALYVADLVTTREGYYRNEKALFDGRALLQNRAYYYIYVEFDDEDGKYCPIEGVTLGQAWISSLTTNWDLWAYTSSDFEWNNLSSTDSETENNEELDDTVATKELPNTGSKIFVMTSVIALVALAGIICYKKYNEFRRI